MAKALPSGSLKRVLKMQKACLQESRTFRANWSWQGLTGVWGWTLSTSRVAGSLWFLQPLDWRRGLFCRGSWHWCLRSSGAFLGWRMPGQAIKTMVRVRANETERHLPEMLDVVALGMRSGLSFDASVRIYARHFDTVLAHELENSCVQWSSGLVRRDEALRRLASTYDSVVFGRVVETVIRSIRHGSSMVASLEADAAEARSVCQSQREERIAKAPVKMMIPTGVLILPAMLIMVLGPVLLELAGGGI